LPTTCDDELVTPTHTGAQWELRSILSQPEKGRDDVTIKISPLDPLSDSQLSDAQYEKAMSLKAEKEAKASQKLAEQEASRAEKEASEAEKAASKAKKEASKAEAKLASVKEVEKAEAAMRVAEAQAEATKADVYKQACTRIDEPDYVKNRTSAALLFIVGEDCDEDDIPLDLMGAVEAKVEDLREQEFNQTYHQLLNASNYHKLKSEAKFLTQTATSLNAGLPRALRNTSVSELTKVAEAAKTKAEALVKVAEEAKAKVAELKSRSKDDDEDMSEESYKQDDDEDESIRRPHRVTVICRCHACCCCVVCAGPCARPARSLGGRQQCGNQYFRVCQVLERGAATPRVLERLGRLP
jgi:hypothetical protein